MINAPEKDVPSHVVIEKYIKKNKEDYRSQKKNHPLKELQDRKNDNICVGRKKC